MSGSISSLADELARHELQYSADVVARLDRYRQLLWEQNQKLNLTRHTTLEKFVTRDVTDSQKLSELLLRGERVLDVGTGGGVPGVILAIMRPDLRMSLAESTVKKARAVQAIVDAMEVNVDVYHTRAEEVLEVRTFDTLVVRAVAPLAKLLTWFTDNWSSFDRLLVIKGKSWPKERAEARHRGLLRGVALRVAAKYITPISEAENVILQLQRNGELEL